MDAGIQGIQGLQCNFSVNASLHTDPGNTGQGILVLWTREYKNTGNTDPGNTGQGMLPGSVCSEAFTAKVTL